MHVKLQMKTPESNHDALHWLHALECELVFVWGVCCHDQSWPVMLESCCGNSWKTCNHTTNRCFLFHHDISNKPAYSERTSSYCIAWQHQQSWGHSIISSLRQQWEQDARSQAKWLHDRRRESHIFPVDSQETSISGWHTRLSNPLCIIVASGSGSSWESNKCRQRNEAIELMRDLILYSLSSTAKKNLELTVCSSNRASLPMLRFSSSKK